MKIHIVQKGDTLWKIAQKYGVDFNALKQVNTQLSNPDMIMPGMKIKVPTGSVPVKKKEVPMAPITPVKEMPQPAPKPPVKEMPVAPMPPVKEMPTVPTPPVKEMPVAPMPPVKEKPVVPTPPPVKEMPVAPMPPVKEMPTPPMPQMPIKGEPLDVDVDLHVQQQMYNYTFNIPTYPTVPYMPKPEAAPIKIKAVEEQPKQVAGIQTEVPAAKELPEMDDAPTMPAQPMPIAAPTALYPPYCVPVTGLLPGSGLPFGYQPVPFQGFPMAPVGFPYGPQPGFAPTAISPAAYEDEMSGMSGVPSSDDEGNPMYPQAVLPAQFGPMMMPQMPYPNQANCGCGPTPISGLPYGPTPLVPPNQGFPPMPAGYPLAGPQSGAMPTAVSPAMFDDDDMDDVQGQGYPGLSPIGAPTTQMPAAGGDCGCGDGALDHQIGAAPAGFEGMPGYGVAPAGFGGMPGYGAAPVGFGGMPGYGAAPAGFGGMPGYGAVPAGFGGMPGYGAAPAGFGGMPGYGAVPAGFGGMPGYGAAPAGFGGMPSYGAVPPGFEAMPGSAGMPTFQAQQMAPSGLPYGSSQTNPFPPNADGGLFREEDDLEDENEDW